MLDGLKRILARWAPAPKSYPGLASAKRKFHTQRAKFYGDFADSIADGANPHDLFSRKVARAQMRRDALTPLYTLWRDRASMMGLAQSWQGTIPDEDVMVVGAGEHGDLAGTLRFLSRIATIRDRNRSELAAAIALPAFLILLLTLIQVGLALGMMPVMVQIMPVDQFPFLGRVLYGLSNALTRYWYLIFGGPAMLALLFFWSLPRWTGRARRTLDRFAPYTFYRDLRASEFLVALAALIESNMSVFDALTAMMAQSRPWLRHHLARMRFSLRSESDMTRALDTGLFSDALYDRIAEYAERSNFEQGIRKIGLAAVEEIAERIKWRSAVLRNVLIVAIGGFILLTAAGILQIGFQAGEYAQSLMVM